MKVWNKSARHLDGRMEFRATVGHADAVETYPWKCVCRVDDGHDHAAVHKTLADGLVKREAVVSGLRALEGRSERVGLINTQITDCNIRILGPSRWELYVGWTEVDLTGTVPPAHRVWTVVAHSPDKLPIGDVLGEVRKRVSISGNKIASAIRRVGEF